MIHQFFIDGHLADIGENTEVTLIYESNLLNGAADIKSSHSLTITLPATVQNRTIFGLADIVQDSGTFAYREHDVEYHRNGLPVIQGGIGRLVKFTPTDIEFVLVFGMKKAIGHLVDTSETLADLDTNASIEFHAVPQVDTFPDCMTNDVFYAALDCVRPVGENEYFRVYGTLADRSWEANNLFPASSYLHPSVRMNWILGLIASRYGVALDFDDSPDDMTEIIVPLISKIPNDITFNGGYKGLVSETLSWGSNQMSVMNLKTTNDSPIIAETSTDPAQAHLTCATAFKGVLRFSFYLYINKSDLQLISYPIYYMKYGYQLMVNAGGNLQYVTMFQPNTVVMAQDINSANRVVITASGMLPIEMDVNDQLTIGINCITNSFSAPAGIHVQGGNIWINEIIGSLNEVQPTQQYPVAGNLPAIKPIDLIKFLCAVTGMFPIQASTSTTLIMKCVSDLFDWSRAVDWSDRLLSPTQRPVAADTSYTPDGWAQKNLWKWKDDDTVVGNYDGGIEVDDETIDEERTVFTFPFAATDGNTIPMYTTERTWDEDTQTWHTEVKWHKVEPRVLHIMKDGNDDGVGYFGFDLPTIVTNYYMDLQATMTNPVVIVETVKMTDLEFMSLDETKPIFMAQHGAYFALLSCELHQNGTAKVKLLRLKKQEEL